MAKGRKKVIVVFYEKKYRKQGKFIGYVNRIIANFEKNKAVFGKHKTKMSTVRKALKELVKATTVSRGTRAKGSGAKREQKHTIVKDHLLDMLTHVQILVRNEKDYTKQLAIIELSGFGVKKVGKKNKPRLQGIYAGPGRLHLVSQSFGPEAVNEWQHGIIDGIFDPLPATQDADTYVDKLKSDSWQFFQHRANIDGVVGTWCKSISVYIKPY